VAFKFGKAEWLPEDYLRFKIIKALIYRISDPNRMVARNRFREWGRLKEMALQTTNNEIAEPTAAAV